MSIADKLTTIAENEEKVFLAGKQIGLADGYNYGQTDGYADGYNDGQTNGYADGFTAGITDGYQTGHADAVAICKTRHLSIVKHGDGSDTMQFSLPFEPDHLFITTNAPEIRLSTNIIAYFDFDLSALGQLAGKCGRTGSANGNDSYYNVLFTPGTAKKYYTWKDGTATVSGITTGTSTGLCYFGNGVEYLITAAKYDLKQLKTRIEESIARLPAQTSTKPVYYQKEKVDAAFTTAEWNALIATKANYTFNLI